MWRVGYGSKKARFDTVLGESIVDTLMQSVPNGLTESRKEKLKCWPYFLVLWNVSVEILVVLWAYHMFRTACERKCRPFWSVARRGLLSITGH